MLGWGGGEINTINPWGVGWGEGGPGGRVQQLLCSACSRAAPLTAPDSPSHVACAGHSTSRRISPSPTTAQRAHPPPPGRSCDLLLSHWGPSLAGSPADRASLAATLLQKVPPHFPVQRPAVQVAAALADQLVLLNVAAAQLLARFLPGAAGAAGGAGEQPWVERLLDWFAGVMADGSALPATDDPLLREPAPAQQQQRQGRRSGGHRWSAGGGGGSGDALPAAVYRSALQGAAQVLPLLPLARRSQLLGAAWQLWQRTSARSSARAPLLAFWQELLEDQAAAFYAPVPGGGPLLQQADAAAWLGALPRFLFELGGGSPGASEAALRLLLCCARCAPPCGALAAALQELQPQLAPLFAVLLPQGKAGPRVHTGPLASLPQALQVQAVVAAGWLGRGPAWRQPCCALPVPMCVFELCSVSSAPAGQGIVYHFPGATA